MEKRTFKLAHPLDVRDHGFRNHPHAAHEILAGKAVARACGHPPNSVINLIFGVDNFRVQLDVRPHIALVGNEAHVILRFLAAGIALGPGPFLQQLLGKGEAVIIAFAVRCRAGIAVLPPDPADIMGFLEEDEILDARFAQRRGHAEPRDRQRRVLVLRPERRVVAVALLARGDARVALGVAGARREGAVGPGASPVAGARHGRDRSDGLCRMLGGPVQFRH